MIIYINSKEHYPKNLKELALLVDIEKELYIGKCVVCGTLCNNKQKCGRYVCSPECFGG